jgi:hypothetical protein
MIIDGGSRERRAAFGVVVSALGVVVVGMVSGWGGAASGAGASGARRIGDEAVVAQVPARRRDPAVAERARLRRALDANPRDLAAASRLARMLIAAARSGGDPRFLGRAEAALRVATPSISGRRRASRLRSSAIRRGPCVWRSRTG